MLDNILSFEHLPLRIFLKLLGVYTRTEGICSCHVIPAAHRFVGIRVDFAVCAGNPLRSEVLDRIIVVATAATHRCLRLQSIRKCSRVHICGKYHRLKLSNQLSESVGIDAADLMLNGLDAKAVHLDVFLSSLCRSAVDPCKCA